MHQQEIIKIFFNIEKLNTERLDSEGKRILNLSGFVNVEKKHNNEIIFNEQLHWENESSLLINSRNAYRWIFCNSGNIKLEHLGFGKDSPVFLVEPSPSGENKWTGIQPHKCNDDLYSAELKLENTDIILSWNVKGPTENYRLKTKYFQ